MSKDVFFQLYRAIRPLPQSVRDRRLASRLAIMTEEQLYRSQARAVELAGDAQAVIELTNVEILNRRQGKSLRG